MSDTKMKPTPASVEAFLNGVEDETKRADCYALLALMREVTGQEPRLWGDSIVGFGSYHYRYASGREGDSPLTGFSPRKQNLTIYITAGFDAYDELLDRLGRFKIGKSCLYVKRLDDVDRNVLRDLVRESVEHMA
ncbi:MAG TPA: DUF1801 domain-containing protein, partial [Ardenticatenaceae bacterium]|nr:DUF1801 domain-containing protein [Ardenticatenaceae bacterium]